MFIIVASGLTLTALVLYWIRMDVWTSGNYSVRHLVLLPLILFTLIYLQHNDTERNGSGSPVFVAIVTDVSLSMGTMPEPRAHGGVGTRLERARHALLPLLTELEASTRTVMVGVTAFTSKAETILAWDDNLPQIREVIEYVLTPGLLTESGSDLGAALKGTEQLFDILPSPYREAKEGKFLILVSDGEQNVDGGDSAMAIAELRDMGVKIISLHVGMPETPEGLPVYDNDGAFAGFDEVGGQIFSVPNPEIMRVIAGPSPTQGIFVKAESADAAETMMDFLGVQIAGSESGSERMGLMLVLWCLTMVIIVRYV